MGQRHQAFIIARVPNSSGVVKYRCVGALHHQWCYGRLPSKATRRFLTLLKQKDNAEIVREELRAISGKYGHWMEAPEIPDLPCPYTTYLMVSAWNIDLTPGGEAYTSSVSFTHSFLPADMGSCEGDNNDGISVIDVTDPSNPAYCYVSVIGLPAEDAPGMVPLSASEYIRAYYPIPSPEDMKDNGVPLTEEEVIRTIESLDGERLVTLEMLAEAWPPEYEISLAANSVKPSAGEPRADRVDIPSLADLAVKPAVEYSLQVGDTNDIEQLLWMPGKTALIKDSLRGQNPFPNSGISLLVKILEYESKASSVVDLSGFLLSTDQFAPIVSKVKDLAPEVLNLSHNPNLIIDVVRQILQSTPTLRRLVLLDTSVSNGDLITLLQNESSVFFNLEAIAHPLFLTATGASYPNAFSYMGITDSLSTVSLPVFTPEQILRSLIDLLSNFAVRDKLHIEFAKSALALQAAFLSRRRDDEDWGQRHVTACPQSSFRALQGEGWCFIFDWSHWHGRPTAYAFLKMDREAIEERKVKTAEAEAKAQANANTADADAAEENTEAQDHLSGAADADSRNAEGVAKGSETQLWKIHDLKSFLADMASEGRPVPPEAIVQKLEKIFQDLDTTDSPFSLMTDEDVTEFVVKVSRYAQMMR